MLNILSTPPKHIVKEGESPIWACSVTPSKRTYRPLKWVIYEDRIREAYDSQDFEGVKYILVRTGEERFYPLPLLLNVKVTVPFYAEVAAEEIFNLLQKENSHDS